jgi:hypothetical protein
MKQSPSWETNMHLPSQETRGHWWNPKVHCRVHKRPPLIPVPNQKNPVHSFSPYFTKIHSNIILPSTPRFSVVSSLPVPDQNSVRISHLSRRMPPDIEGSSKYTEYAVADSWQGVVLQLGTWTWGKQPLTVKNLWRYEIKGGWGGRDMWQAWERGEVFTQFWLGGPKGSSNH